MTTTASPDCQVLVVGAGPSGLVLAAQLLSRGISTRIIDKGDGPALQSRALGIHARTLEMLDGMGLADAVIARGHLVHHLRMYAGGRNLLRLDMARNGSRYGYVLHLPQSETERILRARVGELGGTVEQGIELLRIADHGATVEATLCDASGRESTITASYVVGCDGAHSRVRREIGVPFEGQPYPFDWWLADVALDGVGNNDSVHLFFRPDGMPLTCIPMGGNRWRVVMANAGTGDGRAPTLEEIQGLVAQRAPRPITASDPIWLASFRCQLRVAARYRQGRIFLAGDAAHVHSPAGGQGMNTGMMDAHNLAWKLALVLDGRAAEALLDTYEQERIPVASGVLGFTDKIVGLLTMRHPVKRAIRNTVMPAITGLPAFQRRAARQLSQVAVEYPSSALTRNDRIRQGPRPGDRVPDVDVRTAEGTSRLHRVIGDGRHVVLVASGEVGVALGSAGLGRYADLVHVVDVDALPGGVAFALVRPDAFLAARGTCKDVGKVIDYFRDLTDGASQPRIVTASARTEQLV
jgi:2-polyprenyl-6-methoxyphenol hydroxylase-like FAD-dependent oxidoreductase